MAATPSKIPPRRPASVTAKQQPHEPPRSQNTSQNKREAHSRGLKNGFQDPRGLAELRDLDSLHSWPWATVWLDPARPLAVWTHVKTSSLGCRNSSEDDYVASSSFDPDTVEYRFSRRTNFVTKFFDKRLPSRVAAAGAFWGSPVQLPYVSSGTSRATKVYRSEWLRD